MAGIAGRAAASVRGRMERDVVANGRWRLRPGPKAVELPAMGLVCGSCPAWACLVGETVPVGVRLPAADELGDVPGAAVEEAGKGGVDGGRRRGSMVRSLARNQ